MSIETEATKIPAAIEAEAKTVIEDVTKDVDTEVKEFAAGLEAELATVAPEIKAEVQKAEAAVAKTVKRARVDVSLAEKLAVREIENLYLRAAQDLATAQQKMQNAQNNYRATVEGFIKKYAVSPAEHAWDELSATFKSVERDLAAELRKL